jgi:hypothetical protein
VLTTIGLYAYGIFAGLLVGIFSLVSLWTLAYLSLIFSLRPEESRSAPMRLVQRFSGLFFACVFGGCAIFMAILVAELPGAIFGYAVAVIGFFYSGLANWIKTLRRSRKPRN